MSEKFLTTADEITCPHCGHVFSDSWDFSDQDDAFECYECGKLFSFRRVTSVHYEMGKAHVPLEGDDQRII